ncbi:hypothetical protein M422DRAFT_232584 [Sphaerobolus stellatus SS14]|uniref:Unplaced genomic scaffold SPHSTscaffold_104, whole genome shotgun sequence n=1 Tax=Sphaerobolus stellatus (strain SS14) TaxID=990650 RepID=A0A0C9VG32_SPHS4|nr:hypothetical protein M422DRAFT_232584 [Sphaerobolus stellatus SS14]
MAVPRKIVIEDTDSSIQYVGPWQQVGLEPEDDGNFGSPYNGTIHATTSDARLSFSFNGSSITAYVTNNGEISKRQAAIYDWVCAVDGSDISAQPLFQWIESNWPLCSASDLEDGPHTFSLSVTTTGKAFYMDSIEYIPSPTVPLDSAIIKIDHTDPALTLSGEWTNLNGVAYSTQSKGAEITLDFIGISVTWVGWIPSQLSHSPSSANYTIDDEDPKTFLLNGLPGNSDTDLFNQTFFSLSNLSPGPHVLKVTHMGTDDQTPLTLEYLFVQNSTVPPDQSTDSSSSPSPSPYLNATATAIIGSRHIPLGALIGGIAGGIVLILLVTALIIWRRKRRSALPMMMPYSYDFSTTSHEQSLISHSPRRDMVETENRLSIYSNIAESDSMHSTMGFHHVGSNIPPLPSVRISQIQLGRGNNPVLLE